MAVTAIVSGCFTAITSGLAAARPGARRANRMVDMDAYAVRSTPKLEVGSWSRFKAANALDQRAGGTVLTALAGRARLQ